MINPKNMSVLIADDQHTMCNLIRNMLKSSGYGKKFYFAPNGLIALNVLKTHPIDIAVIDWNMPVLNGIELLKRMKKDRAFRQIPVIMVTGEANQEIVAEAAESEIDAYILKPLSAKTLDLKISSVIERVNRPATMLSYLNRAKNFEDEGDLDAAIEEIKMAMKTDPLSSRPVREMGYCYYKKNDIESAEKLLIKASRMNELDVLAHHYLGELYLRCNDIEKAITYLNKAMDISPRHINRGINFGKILVKKNLLGKAKKVFDKAIHVSNHPMPICEEIADFCFQNKMYDYAIKLMDIILKRQPTRCDIMFKLGFANENLGNHRNALDYLIKARNKDKKNIKIMMHIAKNYMKIDKMPRAEEVLRSVLDVDPGNAEAHSLLGHNV